MKKKHALTEHYLVPGVLFLLNVCLAHIIYAFVAGSSYSVLDKVAVTAAFVLLGSSLLVKKQIHLAGSIFFYTLVILFKL